MAKRQQSSGKKKPGVSSTTSLGKRRSLSNKKIKPSSSEQPQQQQQRQQNQQQQQSRKSSASASTGHHHQQGSAISDPRGSEYGSQASPMRSVPLAPVEQTKVAILGGAGGIGQPLGLLLMLHSEYVQHIALYDLMDSVRGVATDLSHVDRQCKVTSHLGPDELADAVRGAKVIVVPAGLAQRPGMTRDDLFGSNAKIMYNLAKVCAQVAPDAMLAIISNPVNSLVPLACEVYQRFAPSGSNPATGVPVAASVSPNGNTATGTGTGQSAPANAAPSSKASNEHQQQQKQQEQQQHQQQHHEHPPASPTLAEAKHLLMAECHRRIFGVTTLDVVRASTLLARSALFRPDPNGLFKDPSKMQVPVVGGHAGKTIMPLLSQATPKLDRKRLVEDKATTMTLIESIQQAGIEVLNDKKGKGSATLAMAYAACRFTISLLRAQLGEQNIVECAYVRHPAPVYSDLDYFATPLVIGKSGYVKSLGIGKSLLPFEEQMLEEGARELRLSIVKGEDFAKEQLSAER